MQTRRLGNSNLYITPIGLGTWAIGGGGWYGGWGAQDDKDSLATIDRALDRGINWIDTAPYYGRGHSEEIIGKAIAGRRNQVILATKCGMVWNAASGKFDKRLAAESVRREVETSLHRLATDHIDLYQIHTPAATDEETAEAPGDPALGEPGDRSQGRVPGRPATGILEGLTAQQGRLSCQAQIKPISSSTRRKRWRCSADRGPTGARAGPPSRPIRSNASLITTGNVPHEKARRSGASAA